MPSFQVNAKWAAMSEIVPGLYICGVSALKSKLLTALDINLIVNCTKEVPNMNGMACEKIKLWIEDKDDVDLSSHFDTVSDHIRFVLIGEGKALVHCIAGVSRSAAFCLAYLMKYESMSLRQAYRYMASRRPMVRPNLGFWKQLIDYEISLRPTKPPTVRIVPIAVLKSPNADNDEGDAAEGEEQFLPDVYLQPTSMKNDHQEIDENDEKENEFKSSSNLPNIDLLTEKRRHSSGGVHVRFVPRLASVPEN